MEERKPNFTMGTSLITNMGLLSKFRGCMIGSLLGDCLGAPFENDGYVSKLILGNYMSKILKKEFNQLFSYTDDTAMTLSVARSLVENKNVDSKDLAKRFTSEYFKSPTRGYGENVRAVFQALKDTQYEDVYLPARLQFEGSGSYGNGAAMRTSPVPLFGNQKGEDFIKTCSREISSLTHTHPSGYNGALLQCLAIRAALHLDPTVTLDPVLFISNLEDKMKSVETGTDETPYCDSLNKIKEIYTKQQEDISADEIAEYLGNSVAAQKSVPTAIYCFLRGLRSLPDFECLNPFVRTLYFAIKVGGDTDTIASMAGSIAGAYHGAEVVPEVLQGRCESIEEVIDLAEKLFHISETSARS